MTRTANFDPVAWFYDPLSRLVFGNKMRASQVRFFDSIPPGSTILILGGGTGWILDALFARVPDGKVYFAERSGAMLKRAMSHGKGFDVKFIHAGWEDLPEVTFDVAITHYLLDIFSDETLPRVCDAVSAKLKKDGVWLVSDFAPSQIWHRALLWVMYRFFRVTCGIDAGRLPDWEGCLSRVGFFAQEYEFFYGGFLKSMRLVRENAR